MPEWPVVRLADVVQCLDAVRRPVRASDRHSGPYPYYGASGVVDHVDGYLLDGTYTLVAEDGENLRTRKTPVAFLARGKFWVNNHAHILGGTATTDVRYLAYRLENADVSGFLSGSTQPKLTQQALLSMTFSWPPIDVQRTIAEVLGTLYDKIECNERVRVSANETASALQSNLLASAERDGALTEGRLRDVAAVNARAVKRGTGTLRYLNISSVGVGYAQEPVILDWSEAPGRARRGVADGDVLWSTVRPNRESHWLVLDPPEDLVVSTGFAVLTPTSVGPSFLYGMAERRQFVEYLVTVAEGSAYPAVLADRFLDAPIPLPPPAAVSAYEALTMPMRRRAHAAAQESRLLSRLRDLLLPSLVSGELRVCDVESLVR